jgi:hypothetical protein
MSSRRMLVSATTNDALSDQDIRQVEGPSIVNLWASAVTVTDTIGLRLDKTIIMDDGTANVSAAALGMIDTDRDQLIFNSVVGAGELRMPVTVTTSLIFLLSVEPIL